MIYTVTDSRQDRRPNKSRESSHRCLAVLVSCPLLVVMKLSSISCCMSSSSFCHNSCSSRFSSLGHIRFVEKTSHSTVLADLLGEKNIVPTKKQDEKYRL